MPSFLCQPSARDPGTTHPGVSVCVCFCGVCIGLARTIHTRWIKGVFCRDFIKYPAIHGVYSYSSGQLYVRKCRCTCMCACAGSTCKEVAQTRCARCDLSVNSQLLLTRCSLQALWVEDLMLQWCHLLCACICRTLMGTW